MIVRSFANRFQCLSVQTVAVWGRNTVSVLVLVATLAALFLILFQQHGHMIQGVHSRVEPPPTFGSFDGGHSEQASSALDTELQRQRVIAEFLAKRYRVSQDVALSFVDLAHAAGHQIGLDPLLILAVMAVESRFNPIAESLVGAKGLMQIIPKYHGDKLEEFGGEKAVLDPAINILVGSRILKEYLRRTGNLSTALQMYAGALNDEKDVYTNRVMSEKQRLQTAVEQSVPGSSAIQTASLEGSL